jgi:ribosomal protein S14
MTKMKTIDEKEITDQLLCVRFPHLFADRRADMQATAMCWGFEIGCGWMSIIHEAAEKLEPLVVEWISRNPYTNKFPSWIFSRYNMHISLQWRCYSFLAIWKWFMVGASLRQPAPWWPRASQVKEKFGTLRFYMTFETDEMSTIINKAESQSSKTCEACGRPGKIRGKYWLSTRCLRCWRKEQKDA